MQKLNAHENTVRRGSDLDGFIDGGNQLMGREHEGAGGGIRLAVPFFVPQALLGKLLLEAAGDVLQSSGQLRRESGLQQSKSPLGANFFKS